MKWESKELPENQMLPSFLCIFFKIIPSPWIFFVLPAAACVSLLATYLVLGFGFLSVLFLYTSLAVLVSTIFFSLITASNHHKTVSVVGDELVEGSDQREDVAEAKEEEEEKEKEHNDGGGIEKAAYYGEESSDQREDIAESREEEEEEEEEEMEDGDDNGVGVNNSNNYSTILPDSLSNSESHEMSTTSEESDELVEYYWPLDRSMDGSDGTISDEESLIEITLPSGHCSLKQHHHQQQQQQQQHSLMMMELLSEYHNVDMNEEDNLIEIDISMGSIKSCYSRFEIQA
ncbi:nuclear polyadenylated RNA-binding protein 3-like [Prosopis cineraria]|uniref:nuclear polyadenylated RNA-binding protein 3-like n=1 Tax=Prosopis cineraria TaxID=364024 RepID=UPI00241097DE|nr:nuclear polyadenylated RNA-binding protein 3-like [Prosopis cineraria]